MFRNPIFVTLERGALLRAWLMATALVTTLVTAAQTTAQSLEWTRHDDRTHFQVDTAVYDETRHRFLVNASLEWDGTTLATSQDQGPLGAAMAYDANRRETVAFGSTGAMSNDTRTFDGTVWTLRQPTTRPPLRNSLWTTMAYDAARQRVVLFGGAGSGGNLLRDTWEWDGSNWTQIQPPSSPSPRAGHTMAYDPTMRRVLLYGGYDARAAWYFDTWEWDGTDWTERTSPRSPKLVVKRGSMSFDRRSGEILLFGTSQSNDTNALWAYKAGAWRKHAPKNRPDPWNWVLGFDHRRQRTTLFGERTDGRVTIWEWDGTDWSVRRPPDVFSIATDFAHAFDSARGTHVTFGGHDGTNDVDDTYELRGNVWADRSTTSQPTARVGAAMSYDSQRRTVVLNGGFALLLSWNDTVEWDGTSWTWRSPLNRPTPLSHHRLSFDSARNRTVLFGGYSKRTYPSTVSNETWEWDGTNWKYVLTANRPPARAEFGMAFDPVRRRIVVFGGWDSSAEFGDTWEYDGANWMQVAPATSPLSRWGCSMTFDPTRNRIVMHGGQRRSGSTIQLLTDTWDFDGTTWRRLATTGNAVRGEGNITYDTRAGCLVMVESRGVVNRLGIAGSVTALGTGCVSSGSIPRLSANAPWIGTERLSYDMMSTLPSTPCIYGISPRSQNLGLGSGCTLYVVFPLLTFGTVTNSAGFAESSFPLPFDPSLRGVTYHTQAFALDAASPVLGLAFTNAVQTVIGN